jgi:SAM-dependent methyltransferase
VTSNEKPRGSAARWGPLWGARPKDWAYNEELQAPAYQQVIDRVGIAANQQVLDVGCGTGMFLALAAERGAQVFGLDAAESLLAVARKRIPEADLRVGEMQFLPYEDNSFDLVTGFNSFFFAADMMATLRESARVSKTNAAVVIQVWGHPERCAINSVRTVLASLMPTSATGAPTLWQPGALEELATKAGLAAESAFDVSWAYVYPNEQTMLRCVLSAGSLVAAINAVGEDAVRSGVVAALARYRGDDGTYRLPNEWRCLIARAR